MWLLALLVVADSSHAFPLVLPRAESVQVAVAGGEAGAPVVLIPGLFGAAFAYRKVIPRLTEAGYRAIVIEPLGVGNSGRPEHADYSLTAQADRIAGALDQLGVTWAVIVAHATSGSIAYRLAYRRPDLVRAVVSLEGGPVEAAATPGISSMKSGPPPSWRQCHASARRPRSPQPVPAEARSRETRPPGRHARADPRAPPARALRARARRLARAPLLHPLPARSRPLPRPGLGPARPSGDAVAALTAP